ncbi:MAG: divergent PAP2 family protein [Eubacteriales bacterium]|nr:divergent PAP2 family protein [Eubacteriales bacterium]
MNIWEQIISNQVLVSAALAWLVAQVLKTIIDFKVYKSFNPERLVGSGGMPSSHSSTVCALTTSAFMEYGAGSFEFAICFVLAMIVMYDAMGVRLETGKQAVVLNALLRENPFEWKGDILDEKLKEFVGHTPLQVFAGAILGIVMALVIGINFY